LKFSPLYYKVYSPFSKNLPMSWERVTNDMGNSFFVVLLSLYVKLTHNRLRIYEAVE